MRLFKRVLNMFGRKSKWVDLLSHERCTVPSIIGAPSEELDRQMGLSLEIIKMFCLRWAKTEQFHNFRKKCGDYEQEALQRLFNKI
jgi:hypothetical protein